MVIKNIKIFFSILLLAILSIAISNVILEETIFDEIVETEETETLEKHVNTLNYQNSLHSYGDGGSLLIDPIINLNTSVFQFFPLPITSHIAKGVHPLDAIPLFIRYCSLIVYS